MVRMHVSQDAVFQLGEQGSVEWIASGLGGAGLAVHAVGASGPPCKPRGNSIVSLVNSHTNAARIGWHLWEIDLRFAPGLPQGRSQILMGHLVSHLEGLAQPPEPPTPEKSLLAPRPSKPALSPAQPNRPAVGSSSRSSPCSTGRKTPCGEQPRRGHERVESCASRREKEERGAHSAAGGRHVERHCRAGGRRLELFAA